MQQENQGNNQTSLLDLILKQISKFLVYSGVIIDSARAIFHFFPTVRVYQSEKSLFKVLFSYLKNYQQNEPKNWEGIFMQDPQFLLLSIYTYLSGKMYLHAIRSPLLWHINSIAESIIRSAMFKPSWSSAFRHRLEAFRKSSMHGLVFRTGSLKSNSKYIKKGFGS